VGNVMPACEGFYKSGIIEIHLNNLAPFSLFLALLVVSRLARANHEKSAPRQDLPRLGAA